MSWDAKHNKMLKIIELVFTGPTTAQDLKEATSKCIALGKENETNHFLIDAVELELLASLLNIYDLPDKQYNDEKADRFSRIAVVLPRSPQAQKAVKFYETVCVNRGWTTKIMSTRQDALDWLAGGHTSNIEDT